MRYSTTVHVHFAKQENHIVSAILNVKQYILAYTKLQVSSLDIYMLWSELLFMMDG